MKHFQKYLSFALVLPILGVSNGGFVTPAAAQNTMNAPQSDLQTQGDKAYEQKSYARALELYRAAKAAGTARSTEMLDYKIVQSLAKTEKWDEAIAAANGALKAAQWKARFYYALAQIYVKAPKTAWKIGDKTIRQDEYPEVANGVTPERIYLGDSDQKAAYQNFEDAKVAAQKERDIAMRSRFATPIFPLSAEEEADLNFDLAAYLPQVEIDEFIQSLENRKDAKFDEVIDVSQPYAKGWSLPKKVLYLYAEIRKIDQSKDKADSQRSLLAEGLFIKAYKERLNSWAYKYDEEKKQYITRPYPFDSSEPIPVWRRLVNDFPNSPLAPNALILIAQNRGGDMVKAMADYRELLKKYPKSKWATDAKAAIAQIEAKELNFALTKPTRPNQKPQLRVNTRNIATVNFTVYKVKLENFLTQQARLNDPETQFTSWTQNFGKIEEASKKFGAPLTTWSYKTGDKGTYEDNSGEVTAPFSEIGAYAVIATAGGRKFAQMVVISDLALLKKSDKNGLFVYVADAASGEAINGANVVLKEVWSYSPRRVDVLQGKSNDGGFFDKKRAGDNGTQVSAFAYVGNRYALTGTQGGYWYGYGQQAQGRALGYTDRPVYRPNQKVNFRFVVTNRAEGGDWKPVVGREFTIRANNPKGEEVFNTKLKTGEFGSLSGEFNLPADAALGVFNLSITDNNQISGSASFRVEEYKRPEFEVTVSAPLEVKRPGETVAARINAKYYFGAPVPNAKVKYTVRKSTWWASYAFPNRYDWLYSSWGVSQNRRNIGGEGSGEIVKEGEVTTDEKGFAELSFQTQALDDLDENDWWARYSNPLYTIEAEVTDASRRTIEAQGSVKVARQPYFAFLNVDKGYFQKGDRVPVEIRTQDANGQSVAASGEMHVFKLLPGNKEERVFESTVTTDATGKAFWTWPSVDSGQFRIEFVGQGEWGEKVKAQTEVWIVDEKMSAIRLRGVTILLDKRDYQEGDTLKAVLVADKPGANVLLTQEASGQILRRDVFKIDAQSKTISIPIEKQHVPNFFLAAALVQDYEVYQAQAEVFVPPVRSLLDLKIKGDKEQYKPGEKGIFEIEARDWSGKPARAEVSLALIDASLFYIQGDQTPDLRQYYYGERRANTVNLDSSRSGNPEARGEGPDLPAFDTHQFELPDDFGQLQLMPGGFGYYYGGGFGGGPRRMRRGMATESLAMPAPMAAMDSAMAPVSIAEKRVTSLQDKSAPEVQQQAPAQPRTNFSETAYWSPAIITEGGKAKVEVTFPDSLTQWHATARGLTDTVQVASAESDVVTKKDLLVRLQAPRFFVERDEVTISANVHNYSDKAQKITVDLAPQGAVQWQKRSDPRVSEIVTLAAGEEKRVDWTLAAISEGSATIQVTAKTATDSDAVKMSFPVFVHGAPVFAGQSGKIEADGTTKLTLNFPKERQFGASQLNVQLNPSLAATMLDALPYLVDYPYGCVEQTTSRFVPTVLVEKTLKDSGINLATLRQRAAAYEAESKTVNVGERVKNTGYTFPKGQPNSRDLDKMASDLWFTGGRGQNPVFDGAKVRDMTNDGLKRLAAMQRGDGGWGWFGGAPQSDEYMSAYVVYALSIAKNAGVAVPDKVLNGGRNYLNRQMKDEENLQLLTYIAYALGQTNALSADSKAIVTGRLFEQRERLANISKAYLAMTLNTIGETEKAKIIIGNLENTVLVDASNGTARWKTGNQYWYWWNNDVETVAVGLRAFLQIEPKNKLTPMLVKWLTLQSRGNKWRSTKETAEVVYTLAQWVQINRELDVDYTLKVSLGDKMARTYRVTSDNALFFDNRFITGDLFLADGANTLTIEKKGRGVVYYNAYSEYFSKEESIKGSGNELEVTRRFFKLTRKADSASDAPQTAPVAENTGVVGKRAFLPRPRPVPQPNQPEYDRAEIKDGASLKSGDLVEVELVLNAKNDYSYLIFEDMKAAGMETVDVRSGYDYSDSLSYYVELRDEKAAFFVTNLPQGRRVLRYRLRAEIPGTFHALPTNGYAMYAPEVRGTSDEIRVSIAD